MKKRDLKTGQVVMTRNGNVYVYCGEAFHREEGFMRLDGYTDNLLFEDRRGRGFDVIKIGSNTCPNLFDKLNYDEKTCWTQERKEVVHLSDCAIYNKPAFEKGRCNCGAYDVVTELPTYALVEELEKREGVVGYTIENKRWIRLVEEGPAKVLVVID